MTTSASRPNPFGARGPLGQDFGDTTIYRLSALASQSGVALERLPVTIRILLENLLRTADLTPSLVTNDDILALARWTPTTGGTAHEFPFMPARVLLQDFTGVPAVVDLAAMRDAVQALGGDPAGINPLVPADLVIDHSVQVDVFGNDARLRHSTSSASTSATASAMRCSAGRSRPSRTSASSRPARASSIRSTWSTSARSSRRGPAQTAQLIAFPDTLVGTDSHTTMINGLGVLGWGVGGIEAEAVLLGQPLYLLTPEVVGMRLHGALPEGATATDLVLAVTQTLRKFGVVGRYRRVLRRGPQLAQPGRPRDDLQHVAGVRRDLGDLPGGRRDAALPAR